MTSSTAALLLESEPLRFLGAYWNVWQVLAARTDARLAQEHGLDLRSFIALSYIQGEALSPGRLADVMGVPRYEVTRTLDRLTALNAITRTSDTRNARYQQLGATPQGRTLWASALATVHKVAGPPLLALGSRLGTLTESLEQLAAHAAQETP